MEYGAKRALLAGVAVVVLTLFGAVPAWAGAHYSIGVGGSGNGMIPGPGFYYKMYNCFYTADTYKAGGDSAPGRTKTTMAFQVHRVLQNTGRKFLGGEFGWQAVLPVIYAKVSADLAGTHGDKHRFGVGDLQIEPILQWYPHEQLSTLIGLAFFLPVGDYQKNSAVSTGSGSFGAMLSTGFTWYFDKEKTWNFSPIVRYEKSTEEFSTNKRAGDYIHFETNVQKRFGKWSGSVNFAATWQVSDSRGSGPADKMHQRKLQIGPEIGYNPTPTTEIQLKAMFEFKNRNATQGTGIHFTFLKVF